MLDNVIHLFNKYFIIISYEPRLFSAWGHSAINKTDQVPALMEHLYLIVVTRIHP